MKHGRAVIPFGMYKGVRLRLIPNDYLSWLTTVPLMRSERWRWLWDSLVAELKFRGMRFDLATTEDPVVVLPEPITERKVRKREEW